MLGRNTSQFMIFIGVLGLSVALVAGALWAMRRSRGPRRYLAVSTVPLLLTSVMQVPFAQTTREMFSAVGFALSVVLFAIGTVLTWQATRAGDRDAASLLAGETVVAGMPAGVFAVSLALFYVGEIMTK